MDLSIEFALGNGLKPKVIYVQPDEFPGTAGAVLGSAPPFYVLFGDNFYTGKILQSDKSFFTVSNQSDVSGLAVYDGKRLIEKPHNKTGPGLAFTGYAYITKRWSNPVKSARGEYEITAWLNDINAEAVMLETPWEHLSYESDLNRVKEYISVHL